MISGDRDDLQERHIIFDLVDAGEFAGIPAPADGFDQCDAGGEPVLNHIERGLFGRERGRLGGDHAAIGHGAGLVLVQGQACRFPSGLHGFGFDDTLLFQNA